MKIRRSILYLVAVGCIVSGCEDYREVEFPAAKVLTTPQMQPWGINSKSNIPLPIYISCNGRHLRLDKKTTADETKAFLQSIAADYKEHFTDTAVFSARSGQESVKREFHCIEAGIFSFYYDHGGFLTEYRLRSNVPNSMIYPVYIGTSLSALFYVPASSDMILNFDDIRKIFGDEYKITRRYTI